MLMYKKIMSERYYCIKTQCDTKNKLENLEETAPVTDLVRYDSHLNHILVSVFFFFIA